MVECLLIIYVCSKTTWGTAIELKAFFVLKRHLGYSIKKLLTDLFSIIQFCIVPRKSRLTISKV